MTDASPALAAYGRIADRHHASGSGIVDPAPASCNIRPGPTGITKLAPAWWNATVPEAASRHPLRNCPGPAGRGRIGADDGNRTRILSLESSCSAIELHPQRPFGAGVR